MRVLILCLLLPLSVFAQQLVDPVFPLFWDAAKTDTTWAIYGTDSLVSQPFRVKNSMHLQMEVTAGDTANAALDSSKVRAYMMYSTYEKSTLWSWIWAGQDSIGWVDSTHFDRSLTGTLPNSCVSISTQEPAVWAKQVIKGLGTNSKAALDSTIGSSYIIRFSQP